MTLEDVHQPRTAAARPDTARRAAPRIAGLPVTVVRVAARSLTLAGVVLALCLTTAATATARPAGPAAADSLAVLAEARGAAEPADRPAPTAYAAVDDGVSEPAGAPPANGGPRRAPAPADVDATGLFILLGLGALAALAFAGRRALGRPGPSAVSEPQPQPGTPARRPHRGSTTPA
jgi:hypothetical protein